MKDKEQFKWDQILPYMLERFIQLLNGIRNEHKGIKKAYISVIILFITYMFSNSLKKRPIYPLKKGVDQKLIYWIYDAKNVSSSIIFSELIPENLLKQHIEIDIFKFSFFEVLSNCLMISCKENLEPSLVKFLIDTCTKLIESNENYINELLKKKVN